MTNHELITSDSERLVWYSILILSYYSFDVVSSLVSGSEIRRIAFMEQMKDVLLNAL